MAASCKNYDLQSRFGEYIVGTASELTKLPTTKRGGIDELKGYSPCINGSECVVLKPSLAVYFLDGETDTWIQRS